MQSHIKAIEIYLATSGGLIFRLLEMSQMVWIKERNQPAEKNTSR